MDCFINSELTNVKLTLSSRINVSFPKIPLIILECLCSLKSTHFVLNLFPFGRKITSLMYSLPKRFLKTSINKIAKTETIDIIIPMYPPLETLKEHH